MQEVRRDLALRGAATAPQPTFNAQLRLILLRFPLRLLSGDFITKAFLRSRHEAESPLLRKQLADVDRKIQQQQQVRRDQATRRVIDVRMREQIIKLTDEQQQELREELERELHTDEKRESLQRRIRDNNIASILAALSPEDQKRYLEYLQEQHPEKGPAT